MENVNKEKALFPDCMKENYEVAHQVYERLQKATESVLKDINSEAYNRTKDYVDSVYSVINSDKKGDKNNILLGLQLNFRNTIRTASLQELKEPLSEVLVEKNKIKEYLLGYNKSLKLKFGGPKEKNGIYDYYTDCMEGLNGLREDLEKKATDEKSISLEGEELKFEDKLNSVEQIISDVESIQDFCGMVKSTMINEIQDYINAYPITQTPADVDALREEYDIKKDLEEWALENGKTTRAPSEQEDAAVDAEAVKDDGVQAN